jgi:DNA polymerase III delta subunit
MAKGTLPFARLRQALVRGEPEPVYLFDGPEAWFHDEGIRMLEAAAAVEPINRQVVRGQEIGLHELVDLASTYPMGPGKRFLLVREAGRLEPEGIEALKEYLGRPNPRTVLVFSDESFDKRRAIFKALEGAVPVVRCDPMEGEAALATFVRERLREKGYGLPPELAEAIAVGLVGAGLQRLAAELDKLMAAAGAPRPIEAADLAILADVPRVADAFQIAALALKGDRGGAIRGARALLEAGEQPPQILGAVSWYVRTALKARAASDRRVAPRDLAPLYALYPGTMERFRSEVRTLPVARLREAVRLCARADGEIKGGGARDRANAFERLVHGLARAAEGRRP